MHVTNLKYKSMTEAGCSEVNQAINPQYVVTLNTSVPLNIINVTGASGFILIRLTILKARPATVRMNYSHWNSYSLATNTQVQINF